ncbi:MAG TPA: aminotransferase class I/II-fold pyridoxal phosphate-dependent enzyme [Vicinamibacteria bacterium]|nr:aminotransferase class I/II-fold pyridoxal phosphate-dependent enzyme [Vicinamibacteria bacterium]
MYVAVRYPIGGRTASEIAASVEEGVRRGQLGPGTSLPPVRTLATRLEVSPATVAAAYRGLQARGLVTGQGRRGTRVAFRPPVLAPRADPELPAGLRDLASGNPDRALLPPLRPALAALRPEPRLYNEPVRAPALRALAARRLAGDGIPAEALAVVGGAMDGIERVLQAHLRPGDRVAVEDPGYSGVLDLLGVLGLPAEPMSLDDEGVRPEALAESLGSGARAVVLSPRAQNPTGAALTAERARRLRRVLDQYPAVLVVEDDHAGPIAGAPAVTLCHRQRERWAVVRSVSKWLGPDLRVALLAGDPATVGRVEGRQALGSGWVSHLLQDLVVALWSDRRTEARLRRAAAAYRDRRDALVAALGRHGVRAHGRSGLNVWVPVVEEGPVIGALAAGGWAVRGGDRYRIRSGPAIRVTTASLLPADAERLAGQIARAMRPARRTAPA